MNKTGRHIDAGLMLRSEEVRDEAYLNTTVCFMPLYVTPLESEIFSKVYYYTLFAYCMYCIYSKVLSMRITIWAFYYAHLCTYIHILFHDLEHMWERDKV